MTRTWIHNLALAGLAALIALALAAPLAQAEVNSSSITTPMDPSFVLIQPGAKLKVAGTATRIGAKEGVDLNCYYTTPSGESEFDTLAEEVPVTFTGSATSGTISTEVELTGPESELEGEQACRLRAVPEEEENTTLTPFTGPRLGSAEVTPEKIASGLNKEKVWDFEALTSQLTGYAEYESFSAGGIVEAQALNPSTFKGGGLLFEANDGYPATGASSTRSDVQVDGANAYGPAAAEVLLPGSSEGFAGFPGLTVTPEYDTSTGDLTIHESEPLVKCNSEPTYPPKAGVCTEFVPTGVSVQRTIVQSKEGRQATITDNYTSTDGMSHALNLISTEDAHEAHAGYDFPWVDGTNYHEHAAGDTIAPPPAAPANVFVSYNNTVEDGNEEAAQGAITFSSAPNALEFAAAGLFGATHLTASFQRTVPASGSLTLTQVFSWAFTKAEAHTLAGTTPLEEQLEREAKEKAEREAKEKAEREAKSPSTQVTGGGTSGASTTGTAGAASATITKSSSNGHEVVLTIACKAAGAACAGKVSVSAKITVPVKGSHRKRTEKITVATGRFSIAAGQSKTLKLKLTKTAATDLARLGKLATTITATLTQTGKPSTSLTAHLTVHKAKPKKKKH